MMSDSVPNSYEARLFALRELRDYTQHLVGGILGVVEAMGLPEKQFAAFKRLLHREIWDAHYERAMNWADLQEAIEIRAEAANQASPVQLAEPCPVRPQYWRDVVTVRVLGDSAFNPFPFSIYSNAPNQT